MPKTAPAPVENRPVQEIRQRWRNQTAKGAMYTVTVSRSYRDDAGQWHDSSSFSFDELINLSKCLFDAHSAIGSELSKKRTTRSKK